MASAATVPTFTGESGYSRYFEQVRRFPMLERQEEYMLAKRWREHGDRDGYTRYFEEIRRFPMLEPQDEYISPYARARGGAVWRSQSSQRRRRTRDVHCGGSQLFCLETAMGVLGMIGIHSCISGKVLSRVGRLDQRMLARTNVRSRRKETWRGWLGRGF
jgi:hypothetical protein